jgi:hypothetical protein
VILKIETMENIQIQANNNIQNLIGGFSDMPLHDLESVISGLNALVIRKRVADKGKRDKALLLKINQTVLPEQTMERYIFLQDKMELENLAETEYQELLMLVNQEEKIRNKRFKYLLELSQLRNIPLTELMNNLGLNTLNYA